VQAAKSGYITNTKEVAVFGTAPRKGDISITPIVPILNVDVSSLDFGSNLTTLPIEIRNTGSASLEWTVTENINWLTPNPLSGSTTTEVSYLNITIDRTGLNQGYYSQSISITSNGGNATISISMEIANPNSPVVTCAAATNISSETAQISGNISSIGSSNVIQRGHCWSTTPNPTTGNNVTTLGPTSATGSFSSDLSGLSPNTTYYVRAYATNSSGTGYSADQIFTTTSTASVPTLTTDAANNVTETTADVQGAITNLGSGSATQHGHCWATSSNPTTSNYKTTLGTMSTTGSFNSSLTSLSPNTTYYIRAYATNAAGTGYSSQVSFTTSSSPTAPSVTTGNITNITLVSATAGGSISSLGSTNVTQHGHCWGLNANPTTSDNKTLLGTGSVGSFSSNLDGLTAGTTYFVRAYATNAAGTSYGTQQSFTTTNPSTPSITTVTASSINGNSASSGGSISSDGGAPITAKGVCWSTSQNPTTANQLTTDGTGTNSFTSYITGLDPLTTYYVRAYATNSAGTSYGNQISFTTTYTLGQSYGGGVIFYLDGTGQHGLIAAASDQALSGVTWGCSGTLIGTTSTAFGTGQANTTAIVNLCSESGIAARICSDLSLSGYSDWYLPSKDELYQMYLSSAYIPNLSTGYYWSSSEHTSTYAYWVSCSSGVSQSYLKTNAGYAVRAIRSF